MEKLDSILFYHTLNSGVNLYYYYSYNDLKYIQLYLYLQIYQIQYFLRFQDGWVYEVQGILMDYQLTDEDELLLELF